MTTRSMGQGQANLMGQRLTEQKLQQGPATEVEGGRAEELDPYLMADQWPF